jgi:UDP-N-acetylmuramoyl-L-alanyl-D-glutamate--2,6-diaminopimelate ligase
MSSADSAASTFGSLLAPFLTGLSSATSDSREAGAGKAFVAVKGTTQDGHRFIAQAAKAGAPLIVGEEPIASHSAVLGAAKYVQVADSRLALAYLSAKSAQDPSHSMILIGVTGTSGKTTTTYLLESILQAAGHRVGVIGTVNFRFGQKIYPSTHTTPGAPELQLLLAEMKRDGCTAVVMEVSSHALKQHRVAFIAFDAVIFTNLTPEHLDFHPDMEDYFNAKAMLFEESARASLAAGKKPFAAISADDEWGRRLSKQVSAVRHASFGLSEGAEYGGASLRIDLSGIRGTVTVGSGRIGVESTLTGRFNAQNILGALAAAHGIGIPPEAIARGISILPVVPGRLERVNNSQGIHVLVDYAHKPDALEKVLNTLREVRSGHRLITVFGCGGDRDRTKRPVMGRLAATLSDFAIVTSDNPRTENPDAIIAEIVAGIPPSSPDRARLTVEPDRAKAIRAAIASARPGDLVLIAGKGHEDYQIIADPAVPGGTKKVHFDDREIAAAALSSSSSG